MPRYTWTTTQNPQGAACYTARTSPAPSNALVLLFLLLASVASFSQLGYGTLATATGGAFLGGLLAGRVVEESLTLHPTLGLQLCTAHKLSFGTSLPFTGSAPSSTYHLPLIRSARLIPLSKAQSVVIGEGLQGCEGKHYLAVKVGTGEKEEVAVAFPTVLPRLEHVQQAWRAAQALINQ